MRHRNQSLSILTIAQDYIDNICNEVSGMKALMLDHETSGMISIIYTQSKLYKNDIYMIQKITDSFEKLSHLKAIYFLRPTKQNVELLVSELRSPKFYEYHLYFSNEISGRFVEELAAADTQHKVKNLQEIYIDYFALSRNAYSLNIPSVVSLMQQRPQFWSLKEKDTVARMSEGLLSVVMSLRLMPSIRYLSGSQVCQQLADRLSRKMEQQLQDKQSDYLSDRAIVVITQRKEDVISPLLTPWTYQAMLHEFLGVFNNKIDIENKHKAFLEGQQCNKYLSIREKEAREFVLSEITDPFYAKNINSSFGQLANNIKLFINDVTQKRSKNLKLDSLEDMHSALDKMPELNTLNATLHKHVTLSCQISEKIEKGLLFEVSRVEQDLVCQDNRNIDAIWKILKNGTIEYYLKFKLVLIFSVKYPNDKQLKQLIGYLESLNPDQEILDLVSLLAQYHRDSRSDLFRNNNLRKKAKCFFEHLLKDAPNVYTQHRPYLFEETIPDLLTEKLKESEYPTIFNGRTTMAKNRPIVIVFVVGGITYMEAQEADKYEPAKVIIGGNFIHNSRTFMSEVIQLGAKDHNQ